MSDKKEMISELKSIVKPYIQDEEAFENLDEDTDFINDLKINSANLVDVILDIEDKYDIELDNESMDKMLNVKTALDVINTKISEK
jgi:acyl carrier protein